jgi:hypothetical protein
MMRWSLRMPDAPLARWLLLLLGLWGAATLMLAAASGASVAGFIYSLAPTLLQGNPSLSVSLLR